MTCKIAQLKAEIQTLIRDGCKPHKVQVLLEKHRHPKEFVKRLVREFE
jgi:hypothetical protein